MTDMYWEPTTTSHYALIGASLVVSAGLTLGLVKLWRRSWLAVPIAAPAPALTILAWYFYLESQQPYGPFLAMLGVFHAIPALVGGVVGTIGTACYLAVRDEMAAPDE